MSFESLLNNSVTIKTPSYTTDAMGGKSATTWTTLHRRVKCRFNTLGSKEQLIAYDKPNVFADYVVYLKYLSDIHEGDRIYLSTREFEIKLIQDWDEKNDMMKLAVLELGRTVNG